MSYMPMNPVLARRTARILCSALPAPPAICPSVLHTQLALHTAPGQERGGAAAQQPRHLLLPWAAWMQRPPGSRATAAEAKQPQRPTGYYCLSSTSWWRLRA